MAWLSGFSYRKSITLSRTSGAVTLYQMKLLVGESAGASGEDVDCNSHVLSSFNDLRFTAADGETLLDYWIESITGATPNQLATVWIEFDSIGAGATTFYMYYGKADAPAVSSGANTFIVFDDFERGANGDAVGGAWTVTAGAVQISTEHAYGGTRCGKILGGATPGSATIPVTSSNNIAIRFRAWKEDAALQLIQHGDGGGSGFSLASRFEVDEDISIYDGAAYVVKGTGPAGAWQLFEFNDFIWASATCDLWHEGTRIADNADISYTTSTYANKFLVTGFSNAAGVDWYIDGLIVRHYRTTEPAWGSWGAETVQDVTVNAGLQAGSKSLFSVSENTDQVLGQGLIVKAGSLLSPSFVLDHILTQNLQLGSKTILPASNITDQILSQNLLSSIISVLSALASTDQVLSVSLIGGSGSPYDVTVVFPTVGVTVNLGLLLGIFSALSSSVQTDQILNQNLLSILATLHRILEEITAPLENFRYSLLKLKPGEPGEEGVFSYEHSSLKVPDQGPEGSFAYQRLHLKKVAEEQS